MTKPLNHSKEYMTLVARQALEAKPATSPYLNRPKRTVSDILINRWIENAGRNHRSYSL